MAALPARRDRDLLTSPGSGRWDWRLLDRARSLQEVVKARLGPPGRAAISFEDHCDARFDWYAKTVAAGLFVGAMLWWPTDLIVLRHLPEALPVYARWRIVLGAITAAYLLVPRTAFVARHVQGLFLVFTAAGCALVASLQ